MPNEKTSRIALAAVIGLGAALRFAGLGFGTPLRSNYYVRPDESLIVQAAVQFFERHGDPQFFAYPAWMVEICAVLFAALSPWLGDFAENPSAYFLVARVVSAVAGTLTVAVVYGMAREWCERPWALAAAALFAVAPLPVRDAHFGVTDTPMSLLVAATLWMAVRLAKALSALAGPPVMGRWLWTVTVFALAVSTKYTAALAAPALLASAIAQNEPRWKGAAWRLTLGGGLAMLLFAALNPYVFLRSGDSAGTVLGMFHVFYGGTAALPESHWTLGGAAMQVLRPLAWGPGSWAALLLAGGCVAWLRRPSQAPSGFWTLALGVLPFLLALLPFRHPLPFRYLLPALPGLAVLAVVVASRLGARKSLLWPLALAGAALFCWQAVLSVALVTALGQPDTRTLAGEWLSAHVPPEVPVIFLTTPEAEPQVEESRASVDRRITYVYRIYGSHGGGIVSALYRLVRPAKQHGVEVYRNPQPAEVPGEECVLVVASYPLRTAGSSEGDWVEAFGTARQRVEFNPEIGAMDGAVLDASDAFFLPMNPWGRVERPGPRLEILRVRRSASP